MSKYNVQHTCGDWLETLECPRCQRSQEGPVAMLRACPSTDQSQAFLDISVINSFEVKEELKQRGYRFVKDAVSPYTGNDLLKAAQTKLVPAWQKTFQGTDEYVSEKGAKELEWIESQGWKIRTRSGLAALLTTVIEGRPDLVGEDKSRDENPVIERTGLTRLYPWLGREG